ncbi:MAG: GNAT family N-acetyltransferase [Bdellovibrionales bacterium]|nr:GNAT family N-acetyltransferase [Bdellovibrionales bacterium]
MDKSINSLDWYYFKGSDVRAFLLQQLCLFRSFVLYDSGFRQNFSLEGDKYGDIEFIDFDSYHIIACKDDEIIGTIRVTPPKLKGVTYSILGRNEFQEMLANMGTTHERIIEINRLSVDARYRKLNLGRSLIFSSIALIEKIWNRNEVSIIGSAGNCLGQTQFCLKYTDFKRIPNLEDRYTETFKDKVTFLTYSLPPYEKGQEQIDFFHLKLKRIEPLKKLNIALSENYL